MAYSLILTVVGQLSLSQLPGVFSEHSVAYTCRCIDSFISKVLKAMKPMRIQNDIYDEWLFCIFFRTKSKINIKQLLTNIAIKLLIDRRN